VFDEGHLRATGFRCHHKHKLYRWRGYHGSFATVIGDSLTKWVRGIKFTDVQSIPGLNIQRAVQRIQDRTLIVSNYGLIFLFVGTNNFEKSTPCEIIDELSKLISVVKSSNPTARVACSAIICRPRDVPEYMDLIKERIRLKQPLGTLPNIVTPSCSTDTDPYPAHPKALQYPTPKMTNQEIYAARHPLEKKRRATNKAIRRLCKETGCFFMETWKFTECRDRSLNINHFADDGLHLSDQGIRAMASYIEGNTSCLLDRKKRVRRLKIPR
jgi:lysophospholipase L1-like esterase